MSYITLSPNTKRPIEQQINDINNVLELIKTIELDGNIDIAIQYTCKYNQEKVTEIAILTFNKIKDTFIEYSGMIGKFKEIGIREDGTRKYGFFKKGTKKKYYPISDTELLQMAFNN
jgi:UDP-N-acetylglucosamine enolpyruvyl transferase